MSYTQQLYQLQQADSRTDAAHRRLKEIAANLVETPALIAAKSAAGQAHQRAGQGKSAVIDLDLEVKGLQQKITRHETRLYSGKLVNPKEAASLQDEIASTKRWLARREEDLLEIMINLEEAEAEAEAAQAALDKIRAEWETAQATLLAEQQQLRAEIEALRQKRPGVVQFIDPKNLKTYEALRRTRAGVAVAAIENEICRSCGVMLASRLIQQASTDSQLFFCDSCGRIIHID